MNYQVFVPKNEFDHGPRNKIGNHKHMKYKEKIEKTDVMCKSHSKPECWGESADTRREMGLLLNEVLLRKKCNEC